ncbi:uncharacterized protein LOC119187549 [Rhipicephalus microplus]|uniref:uncharacterized protein LOC119187549 n=1 Tax=Rhipicephalus microplus TaxID=6941 RepID=UPI003F6D0AC0
MFAAVAKVKDAAVNGADEKDCMLTASFEATQLFIDDGRQREFAPGAAARAMPGLREQRKTRQHCDVVFRTTDNTEVWAHRFVMCAKYSGCYALFTIAKESMAPEERKGVGCPPVRAVIKDLEGDFIKLLVDFAYHIPMHERIGKHNIVKVLELAEVLKLVEIQHHCLKTLKEDLEPENCIETYHLATSHGYEYLAKEALRYLVRSFDEVWKNNAQFVALTVQEMNSILENDRLNAPSEVEETFQAILKWISADVAARKEYLARFLPLVRFVQCSATEFEKVVSHPEVQNDERSMKVLSVIHQTLTQHSLEVGKVSIIDLSSKQWLTPRVPKDILFVFGGLTSTATNKMFTFNGRAQKWRVMGSQNTTPRAYHSAAVINSCIYFVGGFNGRECYHSVVCFNVPLARWSTKANMAFARCYVSVAVLQGSIYAMGGFDGRAHTRTVECYDIMVNQWSLVADMTEARSNASAAVAYGRIYIAGGFTGATILDSIESYDPSTNIWTHITTMSSPRSGAKVVAHKGMLYIIGGYNGVTRLSSLEQLDVRRGRIFQLPSMPHAKNSFAAVVLDGCIYVIGGYNGMRMVQLVERYDIANRQWFAAPQISTNCSASAACVVEDVADPVVNEPTDKDVGNNDMLTKSSEATKLFKNDGEQGQFVPGATRKSMPGLREQRKTCEYSDVVFYATDDVTEEPDLRRLYATDLPAMPTPRCNFVAAILAAAYTLSVAS